MVANSRSFTVQQRRLECLTLILQWRGATLKDGDVEKIDIGAQDEVGICTLQFFMGFASNIVFSYKITSYHHTNFEIGH
jgi:hypothetical protein